MRVLILIHNKAGVGGSYSRAMGLARGLAHLNHDVTLITAPRVPRLRARSTEFEHVHVVESAGLSPSRWRHSGFDLVDVLSRLRHLSSASFDVVHGFEHRPTVLAPSMVTTIGNQIPFVSDWADLWGPGGVAGLRTWLGRNTIGIYDAAVEVRAHLRASALTVVSSALRATAIRKGFPPERVLLVPPGVDPHLVQPIEKVEARRMFGLHPDAMLVAVMGVSDYDDDLAGRSFVALADLVPGVELLSIGPPKPKMLSVIGLAGLQDRVHDLGVIPQPQLSAALGCADVLLLPFSDISLNRPRFPSRFGEYLGSGRAIVSNGTGDIGRVISDEGVGLAVEDRPAPMATAIAALLSNAELAEQIGRRARRLAEGDFSWDHIAKQVEALYRKAIDFGHGA